MNEPSAVRNKPAQAVHAALSSERARRDYA